MLDSTIREIQAVLTSFLGEPKNSDSGPQVQYNCPCCAERKFVRADNKYNLECNIEKGMYQCWVCGETDGMMGKISSLIKKYASRETLDEYNNILKFVRDNELYSGFGERDENSDFIDTCQEIKLPYGYRRLRPDDENAKEAYEYIKKRGLNDFFINKFRIGYVGENNDNPTMRNRIIIPSYNQFGELNYWVGRDYRGDSLLRYKNPKVEKKMFIFNEQMVNWYDNVTLVEGVFDHMVVPNSIPLLGKSLKKDYTLFNQILKYAKANVNVFLDDDAFDNAVRMYKFLDNTPLKGKIRLIECPNGYDASQIYEEFGVRGICEILKRAKKLTDFELTFLK